MDSKENEQQSITAQEGVVSSNDAKRLIDDGFDSKIEDFLREANWKETTAQQFRELILQLRFEQTGKLDEFASGFITQVDERISARINRQSQYVQELGGKVLSFQTDLTDIENQLLKHIQSQQPNVPTETATGNLFAQRYFYRISGSGV